MSRTPFLVHGSSGVRSELVPTRGLARIRRAVQVRSTARIRRALRICGRADHGSATVLAVGLLAALVLTSVSALGACALLAEKQRVEAAADAAALAAADAASGRVAGVPCERAARAAGLNGARIDVCEVNDSIVEVTAVASWGGVPITVRARAGPPGSG